MKASSLRTGRTLNCTLGQGKSLQARFEQADTGSHLNYSGSLKETQANIQLAVYMYQKPASNHIFGVFCLLDKEGRKDSDKALGQGGIGT